VLAVAGDGSLPAELGVRDGFSDLGATIADWLGIEVAGLPGKSFL
jgi:phosphopentomutase